MRVKKSPLAGSLVIHSRSLMFKARLFLFPDSERLFSFLIMGRILSLSHIYLGKTIWRLVWFFFPLYCHLVLKGSSP